MEDYYVGIDLHRQYFTCYATDKEGIELLRKRFPKSLNSVEKLLNHFSTPPKVVIEATRNWMWLVTALKDRGCEVKLAHPLKTKAIDSARIKTDSIDAKTLCHLLRSNLVPASYVAGNTEQDNRELSRGRVNIVHFKTMVKNRIRAILEKKK